jgi:hypothetical protein
MRFYNGGGNGGFVAHASDGTRSQNHECYVRGMRCWADETRFDGIAVVLAPELQQA